MLAFSVCFLSFSPSGRLAAIARPSRYAASRATISCEPSTAVLGEPAYQQERKRAQDWFRTWSQRGRHAGVAQMLAELSPAEMPAVLGEWGCDAELWSKIRSKRALLEWARTGQEAKARERLELLRNAPSVLGASAAMPALAAQCGCDDALWSKIRSKAALLKLAEAGEEAQLRTRIEQIRAAVAGEAAKAEATAARARPPPTAATSPDTYTREGDRSAPADVARIEALLAERLQAKRRREFDEADALRDELGAMGVEVFDKRKAWRLARGGGARAGRQGRRAAAAAEMPALLGEWGCDEELWGAIRSKGALLRLVDKGNEDYARRRIARMRELVAAGDLA